MGGNFCSQLFPNSIWQLFSRLGLEHFFHSHFQSIKFEIELFIPIPNPNSWELNFSFPFPIPKVVNRFGYFPFPIPNVQNSFPHAWAALWRAVFLGQLVRQPVGGDTGLQGEYPDIPLASDGDYLLGLRKET